MNLNDVVEFFKGYKRMCDHATCIECPVYKLVEQKQFSCCDADALIFDCPDEFAYAVAEWVKSNPVVTNAMKFKEVFGINPEEAGNYIIGHTSPANSWWNKEYKPPKQ